MRLTSERAKRLLEFAFKKKLSERGCFNAFMPMLRVYPGKQSAGNYVIAVDIAWENNGRQHTDLVIVEHSDGSRDWLVFKNKPSWPRVVKRIKDILQRGWSVFAFGCFVFGPSDSLDTLLVEMDLAMK